MYPEIVTLGEPLLEFNAMEPGALREVNHYKVGFGGDTSNSAIAASRLGGRVGYICKLGDDEFSQMFRKLWQTEGVDIRHVIQEEGSQIGIYFISRDGENHSFTYYRKDSAASHLDEGDVPEDYIAQAKVLHTSGISQAISDSVRRAVFRSIEIARNSDTLVSYDPNIRLKLWKSDNATEVVWETIKLADFVLPSLEDAIYFTGVDEPREIVEKILAHGPKLVALKMGSEGVLLGTNEAVYDIEPVPVDVIDTTGAGDAFDGGFLSSYVRGLSIKECAEFANLAAALTTTGWGAVAPIPTKMQVELYLRNRTM